jgi:hypothetical protein
MFLVGSIGRLDMKKTDETVDMHASVRVCTSLDIFWSLESLE